MVVKKLKIKKVIKTVKKRDGLLVDVHNAKGKIVDKISLPKGIFSAKINPLLMAQAVRVYLANQRKGTASTKTRGEVRGSTRKIRRQKHTGRARHGSIRAPIFVGGGIVFGPKPRDYTLKLPKKMKKTALFSALSTKLKDKKIKVIQDFKKIPTKTKVIANFISKLTDNAKNKKVLIIVPPLKNGEVEKIKKAARNIKGVTLTRPTTLNTYEVLNHDFLLFFKESIEYLWTDKTLS